MLADANELVETLKRSALKAVEAEKPVKVCFGKVVSTAPLKINVEQKMNLGEKQLILSRNVTDFSVGITVDWLSEDSLDVHEHIVKGTDSNGDSIHLATDAQDLSHHHKIAGKMEITVHNGLVVGDEVILLRQQKGQKFIVLDRVGT